MNGVYHCTNLGNFLMKRILVATDLSARSERALNRALAIAHEQVSTLEIIHVIDDTWPEADIDRQGERARTLISDALQKAAAEISTSTTILRGQPYAEIVKRATETGADLIVLGIHRSKSREMFRGTTAERVIRLGHTPVLVVSGPATRAYALILVGYDFSVHSKSALDFAAAWLPAAKFHIVHATHIPFEGFFGPETRSEIARDEQRKAERRLEEDLTALKKKFGDRCPQFQVSIGTGLPVSVIRREADLTKPDLIVIGTHGRSGLSHLVLGSVAEELIADADIDVLAVKG